MAIERACYFPEISREEMSAEALALAFDANTNLGKRAVIEAIAATMNSIGDPLARIWLEDANGRGRTYKVDRALAVLGGEADFRCLWAIPESERRNRKSRWLKAAIVDNMAVNGATLFFAIPRGLTKEFVPHITLLRSLAQMDIVPQYGFGYVREYGPPDDFAVGHAYEHGTRAIDLADRGRQSALNNDRAGNQVGHADPYRHALRLIPDVFPLNILSDTLMRRKLGDASFKEWILQNTGFASLTQIGPRCFAWFVSSSSAAAVSAQLNELGLIIATGPRRVH
jgi:hypothetical protein